MSDKPLVQQQLAQELSELVWMVAGIDTTPQAQQDERADKTKVGDHGKRPKLDKHARTIRALTALDFDEGFWHTMQSEWHGVDKFRYVAMHTF